MIWNKNLQVSPMTNMTGYVQSELSWLTALQYQFSQFIFLAQTILNQWISRTSELAYECIQCFETKGPVIILGDFKAHQEIVRDLLFDALTHSDFHVPSIFVSKGPRLIYLSQSQWKNKTIVDDIIIDDSLCTTIEEWFTHAHHDPIISLFLSSLNPQSYNWNTKNI